MLLGALALLVIPQSCSVLEETGDVVLLIKLEYGGEPLVMFDEQVYPDGRKIAIDRFSMYMSELTMDNFIFSDVEYVDLRESHQTLEGAQAGYTLELGTFDLGSYDGFSFNIGLTDEQNAMVPSDFESDNPLSLLGEYWNGWTSYIFAKIEGKYEGDGDDIMDDPMALHVGTVAARRTVDFDREIIVEAEKTTTLEMTIDLEEVFMHESTYDIDATPQIHHLGQTPKALEVADRLAASITLR